MATPIENQKLLYHLTALDNIESILKNGLMPRLQVKNFTDVAEQDIISFRNKQGISNLIPFHFFLGTPFAGIVQKNHIEKEFIYITIHRDIANKLNFKIFPTHPKHMEPLKAYDYEEGIKLINWDLMNERDYTNYECKEVCMAECVAPFKAIPPKIFHSIIVKTKDTKEYIQKLCNDIFEKNCSFYIDVEPNCFIGT
ncbi:DarT ssDNA thymidine ADP-ribosyltransferase family protein [Sulfurimonas sp.]